MKIREIISENNIDESISSKLLGKAASVGAAGIKKALTKSPEEIKFAHDVATIKQGAKIFTANASEFMQTLKKIGLVWPFITYYKNMSAAEDNLTSGKWDQARYDEERRIQIGLVASTLITTIVGNSILKNISSLLQVVKIIPIIGKPAAAIIGGVSNTASLAFMYELNTSEGRTILANLLTVGVIEGAGDIIGTQIDRLKSLADKAEQKSDNSEIPTTTPEKSKKSVDTTTTPEKPTIQQQPQKSTNSDDFVGSQFVRGPDGELRLAVDQD